LFTDFAKPAFPVLEIADGSEQVLLPEIRPECLSEIQFCVGNLPEQKIAYPEFAACPD
jgi:hypothetical protein